MEVMNENELGILKEIIRSWPAYESLLSNHGIDPQRIARIEELPLIDKKTLAQLFNSISIHKIKKIIPSSGTTGQNFSFGLFGSTEMQNCTHHIELFLKNYFQTDKKKSLLLNLLPGALNINCDTAALALIGPRIDTALSAIKTFGAYFDQLILIGEPLFIKNLIEAGQKEAIDWKAMPVRIVVGGEWIPESYRIYLLSLLGDARVYSSMGTAEMGFNYFFETDETIALRQLFFKRRYIARDLFGTGRFIPMLFTYNPGDLLIETIHPDEHGIGDLVVTILSSKRTLPLVRFRVGDKCLKLSARYTDKILKDYFSSCSVPLIAHFGRGYPNDKIVPEWVKEVLYSDQQIPPILTGNFFLNGKANSLNLQLKEGIEPSKDIEELLENHFSALGLNVQVFSSEDFSYPLDYERKCIYVR